ncbi:RNA polymerase sigma factor [Flindersiella endophytica]
MTPAEETDDDAFVQLYEQHYWAIVRFATRRVDGTEAARDVAAETFVVAWRRRDRIPKAEPLPWLYRVAGNLIRNEYRRRTRDAELHARLRERAGQSEAHDRSAPDLADHVAWSQRLDAVLAALRTLSEKDQEVLRLHAWEGLAGKDLAVALGCTTGSAAVRLHRARRRLERALRSAPDNPGAGTFHLLSRRALNHADD